MHVCVHKEYLGREDSNEPLARSMSFSVQTWGLHPIASYASLPFSEGIYGCVLLFPLLQKNNDAGFQMFGGNAACMASKTSGDLTHICFNIGSVFPIILVTLQQKEKLVPQLSGCVCTEYHWFRSWTLREEETAGQVVEKKTYPDADWQVSPSYRAPARCTSTSCTVKRQNSSTHIAEIL